MLFYVFLHHYLSIFLIFNNFLPFFFLCFPLFFVSFGSLQPPQGGAVTCQGGAAALSASPQLRPYQKAKKIILFIISYISGKNKTTVPPSPRGEGVKNDFWRGLDKRNIFVVPERADFLKKNAPFAYNWIFSDFI